MSFKIDTQTLDELNIPGKYRSGSVFSLFNKVRTTGAELLLEKMFKNPLATVDSINERASLLEYFQKEEMSFPFDDKQLLSAEQYLESFPGRSLAAVATNVLKTKSLQILTNDERYAAITDGILTVAEILYRATKLLVIFDGSDVRLPFFKELLSFKEIVSHPGIAGLNEIRNGSPLKLRAVIRFDLQLRVKLKQRIAELIKILYVLDVYIAVAAVGKLRGFNFAKAVSSERAHFIAEGLRHPGLDRGVQNPIRFDTENNVIFLTGANMAGKSTLMKSIGVNLYLAHMGFPVAAESLEFTVLDGIYSSINVTDSISRGYSHFYAEVLRVKQVAEAVAKGERLLVIFDELFKGTNVKDAYDGTLAVTAAFSEYRRSFFIISTHIIEAGQQLKHSYKNIQMLFMPTIMKEDTPVYTYKLTPGISADRHGMRILENEGIFEMLSRDK